MVSFTPISPLSVHFFFFEASNVLLAKLDTLQKEKKREREKYKLISFLNLDVKVNKVLSYQF